jgi:hypothetical protein
MAIPKAENKLSVRKIGQVHFRKSAQAPFLESFRFMIQSTVNGR